MLLLEPDITYNDVSDSNIGCIFRTARELDRRITVVMNTRYEFFYQISETGQ